MEVSGRKVDEILCEPCGDNGQKLSAAGFCVDCGEFLCITCYKCHLTPKPSRHHVLQDKEAMPRTKLESTTPQITSTGDKCLKHKGEIIKYYCRSDHQLGCGSCMITNHRRCEELISIEEEYEKFDKEIQDFGLQLDKNSETKDQNSIEIENNHSQAVKDIKLFMKDVRQFYENLEKNMLSDVDKVKDENKKKMESISATCMTLRHDLQSLTSDLSKLHQPQQNGKLFTMMEEAKDQMNTIKKDINEMSNENKVLKYTFVPEKQIEDLIGKITTLGKLDMNIEPSANGQTEVLESSDEGNTTLKDAKTTPTDISSTTLLPTVQTQTLTLQTTAKPEVKINFENPHATNNDKSTNGTNEQPSPIESETSNESNPSTNSTVSDKPNIHQHPFKPRQLSEVLDIPVKSSTDEEQPYITGIVLLPGGQLVLADYNNEIIKLVNTKQNKIVTELKLYSSPWDITAVNNNLVAMTMPGDNQIQLVSVSNSNLSQGQTIKVNGQCHGVVHTDGTFIVTYTRPIKLEIILISGKVLKVIDKGPNGKSLFVDPWYIALSPDNTHVYISDSKNDTVTCMTLDGKVKSVNKDNSLRFPRGLTVDKTGSVYVVCYPYYIYQISGGCSQGRLLQGSEIEWCFPQSITYCYKEDKLYVGCDSYNIKVFQLK